MTSLRILCEDYLDFRRFIDIADPVRLHLRPDRPDAEVTAAVELGIFEGIPEVDDIVDMIEATGPKQGRECLTGNGETRQ